MEAAISRRTRLGGRTLAHSSCSSSRCRDSSSGRSASVPPPKLRARAGASQAHAHLPGRPTQPRAMRAQPHMPRAAAPPRPCQLRSGDRSGTRALPPILLPDKLMRKGINMRVPSGHGHRACCARSGRGAPRGVRPADSSAGARLLRRKASSAVSDGADVLSSSSCTSPGPENAYR